MLHDAAMDGELLSCDLKCSTHLGQSSSMTRKDRDLLRFDAGHFWIVDTSNKMLERTHTWHYLTWCGIDWNRAIACSIDLQMYTDCLQEFMKKAKAITVARAQLSRWRDFKKGRIGPKRRETMAMAQSFNNLCDILWQGPNWRQEAQGLKLTQESKRTVTVNVLRKSWNRGLVPR